MESRAEDEARVGRLGTSSSWRFGVHSRRACRERRRVAGSRSFREEPGAERAGGAARARLVAGGHSSARCQTGEGERTKRVEREI